MKYICLFIILSGCVCSTVSTRTYKNYGYQHIAGTTGINMILHSNTGETFNIKFSKDSDPISVEALMKLDWSIVYPNADGKGIFFFGELNPVVNKTDSGINRSEAELFRSFTLKHWCIKTPFKKQLINEEDITASSIRKTFNSLESAGFKSFFYEKKEIMYSEFECNQ